MSSQVVALGFADVWRATLDTVRRDRGLYLTLAAAFVLVPAVATTILGPPAPKTIAEMQGAPVLVQGVLAVFDGIVQLCIARLVLLGGDPREALVRAVTVLPRLFVAALLTGFALMPAVALIVVSVRGTPAALLPGFVLLIPGLFVFARLSLALPLIATRPIGSIDALRLSWAATAGNGWRILGVLAAMFGVVVAVKLLSSGVGMALGSTLTLLGAKAVAGFIVALIAAAVACVYSIYNAVALAEMCRRLVR